MRQLKPPSLQQWGCMHQWHVTNTLSGWPDSWSTVRYRRCQRCGLRVKTEERLAVPWDEGALVAQVRQLLPERQAVALRKQGITTLPLAGLNRLLMKHHLVIQPSKGGDPSQMVACVNDYGKVEHYGLFELQRKPSQISGRKNGKVRMGKQSLCCDHRTVRRHGEEIA
jgi:hypothetical protein